MDSLSLPRRASRAIADMILNPNALRVLVVDDYRDATDSLDLLLHQWGHNVYLAYDGRQALESATKNKPDVVLLDLALPGMDGYAVAREIRRNPELTGMQLVATTGYTTELHRRRAEEAGFNEFLIKPVPPLHLQALLERLRNRIQAATDRRVPESASLLLSKR